MSEPYENSFGYPLADQVIQHYGSYDNSYTGPQARMTGPPIEFEGVGFWYRPERAEPYFDSNAAVFNQDGTTSTTFVEPAVSMKHRRTRSGCFTCRQRRVKCDEKRPMCERCRKGSRQCDYPQTSSLTKRTGKDDTQDAPTTSQSQNLKEESGSILDPIEDESEYEEEEAPSSRRAAVRTQSKGPRMSNTQPTSKGQKRKQHLDAPTASQESDPVHQTVPQAKTKTSTSATQLSTKPRWHHLRPQMQDFLQFQHDHMTHHHYFFVSDPTDFLHTTFIDLALSSEPLLYAVVGFAAYHHAIQQKNGRFEDFWKYYCRSIVLLRKQLEQHTERNETVLLTILQLATFEEFLGDWGNCSSHHRAAHSILGSIYNYDNFLNDEISRHIFEWFARVDLMVGLIAGSEVSLEREWFATAVTWHEARYRRESSETHHALSFLFADINLLSYDMARIFANALTSPSFQEEVANISQRLDVMRLNIQALHDISYTVTDIDHDSSDEREDSPAAFNPHIPLFRDHLWPLNFVWLAWYGSQQFLLYQTTLLSRAQAAAQGIAPSPSSHTTTDELPPALERLSMIQCQIYEAVEQWSEAPAGAVLSCHTSMALAAVFLRREPKYIMWARRKLANVEGIGYMWPLTLRQKMAQLWGMDELEEWWLPDGDGKFPLLDEIRAVVKERNRENIERGHDDRSTDIREIKAVFDRLDISTPSNTEGMSASSGSGLGSPSDAGSSEGLGFGLSPSGQTGNWRTRGGSVGSNVSGGRQTRKPTAWSAQGKP